MEEGTARARIDRGAEERFVPLRRQLGVTSFGMNEMILEPGQRSRIHIHEHQEEVFLVLAGELTIAIDGAEETLKEDELIRVAPAMRRQLINKGREKLIMLAVGGHGEHQGRDAKAFEAWDQEEGRSPRDTPVPEDLPVD